MSLINNGEDTDPRSHPPSGIIAMVPESVIGDPPFLHAEKSTYYEYNPTLA